MSHYWTFSPSSNSTLQRCLDAAIQDPNSKWLKAFGTKNKDLAARHSTVIILNDSPDDQDNMKTEQTVVIDPKPTYDDTIDITSRFDSIQDECIKNPKRLVELAENLPRNTVEDLSSHVFEIKDVKQEFLVIYFQYFIPNFVKQDNSRYCTDLLLNTYKTYRQYFKIVLKGLIQITDVQNNVLQDFLLMLDKDGCTELIVNLSYIELTAKEFVHNIFSIHTAYKTCNKTENIQNFILTCLKNYSNDCVNDKNYGRLMLSYLQHEKSLNNKVSSMFSKLLELHRSAFVRPCLAIYKEIADSQPV